MCKDTGLDRTQEGNEFAWISKTRRFTSIKPLPSM